MSNTSSSSSSSSFVEKKNKKKRRRRNASSEIRPKRRRKVQQQVEEERTEKQAESTTKKQAVVDRSQKLGWYYQYNDQQQLVQVDYFEPAGILLSRTCYEQNHKLSYLELNPPEYKMGVKIEYYPPINNEERVANYCHILYDPLSETLCLHGYATWYNEQKQIKTIQVYEQGQCVKTLV